MKHKELRVYVNCSATHYPRKSGIITRLYSNRTRNLVWIKEKMQPCSVHIGMHLNKVFDDSESSEKLIIQMCPYSIQYGETPSCVNSCAQHRDGVA